MGGTSGSRVQGLDGLFRPRSVAVIGASRREGAIGRQVVANIAGGGFTGPVYPVNPKASVVNSIVTYKSVASIPGPVDLAVLVVPPDAALRAARQCGEKGVKGLVVVTAGFREIGGKGIDREEKLSDIAERYGMRVIGPNCMGIVNTEPDFCLNATFASTLPEAGRLAMVTQSGALGEAILADATEAGLGVAMFASVGNRVDVTAADLIEYWEDDPHVGIILLYLESFGDPSHFVRVARRVGRKKPIIAVKSGRSAAGAAAVGSHTGSVAGGDLAAESLLNQCGVLRVDSFRMMFSLARALLEQPLPRGDRIAVVTNAGGPGILATDALVGCGLNMAELSKANQTALRRSIPPEASTANPVDLLASADAKRFRAALRVVLRDPGVDALLVMFVSPVMIDAEEVAEAIVEQAAAGTRPVLACIMGRQGGDEALEVLAENSIPVFRYPEDAARTLRALVKRARMLARRPGKLPSFTVRRTHAWQVLEGGARGDGWLTSAEAEAVLHAYGVPFADCRRVETPGEAVTAANELGFPVVLKAEARGLLHKSEHHAVSIGLHNDDDVFEAATDLVGRLRRRFPGLMLQVQTQAPGRLEVLLGMKRDERYGPLFVLGLGGIEVEVLRDVSLRIGPLDDKDPVEMIDSLKGAALFDAFRGEPAVNRKAVQEALLRMQQLVQDFVEIEEVEINPFMLGSRAVPSLAVDARLRVRV